MKQALNSLRFRFIASTVALIILGLVLTGVMVATLMRIYITQGFHDEMQIHIQELAALTAADQTGQPFLHRRLSDPRFIPKQSGFYWEVRRDGFKPVRSPSLDGHDIIDWLSTSPTKRWAIVAGPTGQTLEYGMTANAADGGAPYRLSIASDMRILDETLNDFDWPLGYALAIFAALMIVAGFIQIAFGLRPLHKLGAAISNIRSGNASAMEGSYPSELTPLVTDINALLDANAAMVKKARVQAGNLAHGLRTPLAILLDEAERLQAQGLKDSAETLQQVCSRMQRQINYHLARARTAAALPTPGQVASVRDAISPILTAMRRLHAQREITICCANLPDVLLSCDEIDLGEILANLIDNACKWTTGRVMVSWETDGRMALILIDDDGPGLAIDARRRAFEIGERLDETTPGTGLGLAIVRDLVQLHGGTISLDTSPLGGLRATINFPVAPFAAKTTS